MLLHGAHMFVDKFHPPVLPVLKQVQNVPVKDEHRDHGFT